MNNPSNPTNPASKESYVICPTDNGDGIEVDKNFYEFFRMLSNLQTLTVTLDTISDTDYHVIEAAILNFKFKDDTALRMQQLLKEQIYYDSNINWDVSFHRLIDHKNKGSEYDFSIEVNLKHIKRITYQGVVFLPTLLYKPTEVVESKQVTPPNVTIH